MIDHTGLVASDVVRSGAWRAAGPGAQRGLARSKAWYECALAPIGYAVLKEYPRPGTTAGNDGRGFWRGRPAGRISGS